MSTERKKTSSSQMQIQTVSSSMQLEEAGTEKQGAPRGQWGSQLEFIMTCVSFSVGLGNVWRFPYLVYQNGGGAFLIPYAIMMLFVGIPLFLLEIAFGQFAGLGPLDIWKAAPLFQGLGYAGLLVSAGISLYYNVIIAYATLYFFYSLNSEVPWAHCREPWASICCWDGSNETALNSSVLTELCDNTTKTPSEDFFYRHILDISGGIDEPGGIQWQLALSLLLAWIIVFVALSKGVASLGKVSYFTAIFPYIMLTVLLIGGCLLDGAADGLIFYLEPKVEKLQEPGVWQDAAVQVFYGLGLCSGGLITMSSFNTFTNNCRRDAFLIPLINGFTSIFAGLCIFSILGAMAKTKGVGVEDVATAGTGLAFVVYPEGLVRGLPFPPIWSALFFFMLMILGFGSEFSLMETIMAALIDKYDLKKSRKKEILFRAAVCLVFFLVGLLMVTKGGQYLVHLLDKYVGGFALLVIGVLEAVVICYVYGLSRFSSDLELMFGVRPSIFWRATWCFIAPVMLVVILIMNSVFYKEVTYNLNGVIISYPDWATAIGWIVAMLPIVAVPVYMLIQFCSLGGIQVLKDTTKPVGDWGPADPAARREYGKNPFAAPPVYKKFEMDEGHRNHAYHVDERV